MNKDLTVGKPSQVLWQFCLPMFGSIIFQQLYLLQASSSARMHWLLWATATRSP